MSDCTVPGWGTGPWGITPWGGQPVDGGSGALPTTALFDIYCFGPCGPMAGILTHPEVSVVEAGPQFSIDGATLDLVIESGGGAAPEDAQLLISTPVPEKFTFEATIFFQSLPPNFNALPTQHVYLGIFDAAGAVVGLFFSRVGIAYSGSVHFDSGALVLDGPLQGLPDSQELVSEGEYFTLRVACDSVAGVVYVYFTRTSQLNTVGHQLRFILPTLLSSGMALVPPDETSISVRGTPSAPSRILVDNICLGTGLLIPNLIPFADAGLDQALQRCTIAALDGSRSFDPEGASLSYRWRLIDAPLSSQSLYHGLDGATYPQVVPTGYTDRFYSEELAAVDAVDAFTSGDVLVVAGTVHVLASVGIDGSGFYVRVEGYALPDNFTGVGFKVLRQRGIAASTTVKPTFYPDSAGLYRFDLVVYDGNLFSAPSTVVLNVTESPVARGVTPNLSFIWNYLSDFWRLVEDTERIEAFWSALAQVAAAELLNLWQVDYSKSLRDIQRSFQRRWLHYDFPMQESLPELSIFRALYSGIESTDLSAFSGYGYADDSVHLDLAIDGHASPLIIHFPYPGFSLSNTDLVAVIQGALSNVDPRIVVRLLTSRDSSVQRIRIEAPCLISVVLETNSAGNFNARGVNGLIEGSGSSVNPRSYRVDRSLLYTDIQEGDFLVLAGSAYRIARTIDDPSDLWAFQRLSLLDEMPVPAPTAWSITSQVKSRTLDFEAGLAASGDQATVEVVTLGSGDVAALSVPVLGTSAALPSTLAIDASSLGRFLSRPTLFSVFLKAVVRRTYLPLDPLVVDIPYLQEMIQPKDDTQVLRRNVDYFLETFRGAPCLRFITGTPPDPFNDIEGTPDVWQYGPPPARMWAEVTYLDNRSTIEANFGIPAGFTLDDLAVFPSHVDYLSSVRGLWYAYFNGPTLFNLKAGTQILLGLPFAEEAGTIEEIRTDFSSTQGRILVRDAATTAIVRSYTYPSALLLEVNPSTDEPYGVGDPVSQFAPLVTGVEVVDWVKDPRWFGGYLGQGVFYEIEKFFKFLVRVDSEAFNLAALLFVQSFVRRIKPTYTFPLFVIRAAIGDTEISTTDAVRISGRLLLNDLGVTNRSFGMSTMVDEARAAGGGWQSRLDTDSDPATGAPTSPTAQLVLWGADKNYLAPEDAIVAACTMTMPHLQPPDFASGPPDPLPFLDGLFRLDLPLYDTADALGTLHFHDNHVHGILGGESSYDPFDPRLFINGYVMELDEQIATTAGTYSFCQLDISGDPGDTTSGFKLLVEKNGATAVLQEFPGRPGGDILGISSSVAVVPGDVLRVRLRTRTNDHARPHWHQVTVQLFRDVPWALDTPLPAGNYGSLRAM